MIDNFQYIWFLTLAADAAMTFNNRLVYSALVKDARFGSLTSMRAVASQTGLSARAVRTAFEALAVDGLITASGGKWKAVDPSDRGLFAVRRRCEDKPWFSRFAGFRYFCKTDGCPLSCKVNALYCLLLNLANSGARGQSKAGWSSMLDIDERTVAKGLEMLADVGLVQHGPGGQTKVLLPSDRHSLYWQSREAAPRMTLSLGESEAPIETPTGDKLPAPIERTGPAAKPDIELPADATAEEKVALSVWKTNLLLCYKRGWVRSPEAMKRLEWYRKDGVLQGWHLREVLVEVEGRTNVKNKESVFMHAAYLVACGFHSQCIYHRRATTDDVDWTRPKSLQFGWRYK